MSYFIFGSWFYPQTIIGNLNSRAVFWSFREEKFITGSNNVEDLRALLVRKMGWDPAGI